MHFIKIIHRFSIVAEDSVLVNIFIPVLKYTHFYGIKMENFYASPFYRIESHPYHMFSCILVYRRQHVNKLDMWRDILHYIHIDVWKTSLNKHLTFIMCLKKKKSFCRKYMRVCVFRFSPRTLWWKAFDKCDIMWNSTKEDIWSNKYVLSFLRFCAILPCSSYCCPVYIIIIIIITVIIIRIDKWSVYKCPS